jgi:hypothetical protein
MKDVLQTTGKVTGCLRGPETDPLGNKHLIAGLVFAWLAGMGRYWDHPHATLLQHLGVGSVVYVIVLAGFIWLLGLPLRLHYWSYCDLLTYISLTSPLAFLYALPVERWVDLQTARKMNMWFLLVVAAWRVLLYSRYLSRRTEASSGGWFIMLVLPLALIVNLLHILNLEHVIFNIMAGIDDGNSGSADAYSLVTFLALLSWLLWPPTLIAYFVKISQAWRS